MKLIVLSLFLLTVFSTQTTYAEVRIPEGVYTPIFREPGEGDTKVGPLLIDETPVTNAAFADFVDENPEFKKSAIKALFADSNYLSHWTGDGSFKKNEANHPVVFVSWFAARRYCQWRGGRLPTIAEWEYASVASDLENEKIILAWYSKPNSSLRDVSQGLANKFGIKDMHGHIWEWVDNFSETIMSGDSRGGSSKDAFFCGGAALKAKDPTKYAAFIRFAFRSSLTAQYTSQNLGFRCVRDKRGEI